MLENDVMLENTVEPLKRPTRGGQILRRPPAIEAEIAAALGLGRDEILARAAAATGTDAEMSSECMVHLIRRDLHRGSRQLAEELTPLLLGRCEAGLRGSIRGFAPSAAAEVREEILGRLAISLVEPGDQADFLEVRFALAMKRLRIDVCRVQRRRERGRIALDDAGEEQTEPAASEIERQAPTSPARQEAQLLIRQALSALTEDERKVVVLHKLAGFALNSKAPESADLVSLLGFSERTLRNRLRSAEAKLRSFQQETR